MVRLSEDGRLNQVAGPPVDQVFGEEQVLLSKCLDGVGEADDVLLQQALRAVHAVEDVEAAYLPRIEAGGKVCRLV